MKWNIALALIVGLYCGTLTAWVLYLEFQSCCPKYYWSGGIFTIVLGFGYWDFCVGPFSKKLLEILCLMGSSFGAFLLLGY